MASRFLTLEAFPGTGRVGAGWKRGGGGGGGSFPDSGQSPREEEEGPGASPDLSGGRGRGVRLQAPSASPQDLAKPQQLHTGL